MTLAKPIIEPVNPHYQTSKILLQNYHNPISDQPKYNAFIYRHVDGFFLSSGCRYDKKFVRDTTSEVQYHNISTDKAVFKACELVSALPGALTFR